MCEKREKYGQMREYAKCNHWWVWTYTPWFYLATPKKLWRSLPCLPRGSSPSGFHALIHLEDFTQVSVSRLSRIVNMKTWGTSPGWPGRMWWCKFKYRYCSDPYSLILFPHFPKLFLYIFPRGDGTNFIFIIIFFLIKKSCLCLHKKVLCKEAQVIIFA